MRWRFPTILACLIAVACSGSPDDGAADGTDTDGGTGPGGACELAPLYDPIKPTAQWEKVQFEGNWLVVQYFPPNMKGLVWYFHGTGGMANDVYNLEPTAEVNTLIGAGFGFVATNSTDRSEEAQWNDGDSSWETNTDLARLDRIYADLIAQGRITSATPIVTMGFSQGGSMATYFGELAIDRGYPIKASSIHNSNGQVSTSKHLPQIWIIAEHDHGDTNEVVPQTYQQHLDAGDVAAFYEAVEGPLDPKRFMRIPGYTEENSQSAFDELVEMAIIDPAGTRLFDIADLEYVIAGYEANSSGRSPIEISNQTRVVWSTHRFDSQFAVQDCQFLLDALSAR